MPTQEEKTAMARRMATAFGHDPDVLIFHETPHRVTTPVGVAYYLPQSPVPMWTAYYAMAETALALMETK